MNRIQFIKGLISAGAFSYLPKGIATNYKKFYLLQFFVAGFRFYDGMKLLHQMSEGDLLKLGREPDNKFDECAVALYWNDTKIGFVPQAENEILSRLIDGQALDLLAEITHLNKEVQPWENLCVAISFLKQTDEVPPNAAYMAQLMEPEYYTYKRKDDIVTRVDLEEEEIADETNEMDWYNFFVKASNKDSIFDIIHSSDVNKDYEYGRETGWYILVNINRLPSNIIISEIKLEEKGVQLPLDVFFEEKGYALISTDTATSFVPYINSLRNVSDVLGRHYIELMF
jgi:hypothetical protein